MRKQKLKFKKLLNEYRSLHYELEYVYEVVNETHEEFDENLEQYCEKNNIELESLRNEPKEEQKQQTNNIEQEIQEEEVQEEDPEFDSKKLFRQVARTFHPDTMTDDDPERDEKEEVFKRATKAIDEKNWGELFDIADRYDLDLGDYGEVNKSLSLDNIRMREKIKAEKRKFSWLLHSCEDDQVCRDQVAKMFLKHVYGI
jgi:hypothetical protein